jgi:ribosomal protein S18 acetylase RimI-like enzyme
MASIAVKRSWRGRGIARSIIEALVASHEGDLYLMCRSGLRGLYENCGFCVIGEDEIPRYFQRVKRLAGLADFMIREGESLLVMKQTV